MDPIAQVFLVALPYRALVLVHRGDVVGAAALTDRFLPRAREVEDPQIVVPALVAAALAARAQGHREAAGALIAELESATRGLSLFHRARFLPDALRIALAAGRWDLVERLAEEVATPAARPRHSLATGSAIVAEARGALEQAATLYGDVADRWLDFGFVLEEGQAAYGRGRCLVGLGRRAAAEPALRRAREIFGGLGARPLVAEVDDWLHRAVARTS